MMTKANVLAQGANTAGNVALSGTVGGGGVLYLMGQNAPAIGAICVIIGLIATIFFKAVHFYELKRHHREIEDDKKT